MTFPEILTLLLAFALPSRELCIFAVRISSLLRVVGHLILSVHVHAEVRARQRSGACAYDWTCICSLAVTPSPMRPNDV